MSQRGMAKENSRRDDGHDPFGLANHKSVFGGDLAADHTALAHAGGAKHVLGHVDSFHDVGERLIYLLAALARDQLGE